MSRMYSITSFLGVYECLQGALVLGFLVVFILFGAEFIQLFLEFHFHVQLSLFVG